MEIVIDKSYLQGASPHEIRGLYAEHTILFIETLLYELLTTETAVQRTCFDKLSEGNDKVVIVPCTGPLIRYEMESQQPASPLIGHQVQITFQSMVDGVLSRPLNEHPALAKWRLEVQREIDMFHQVARGIAEWCPALLNASGHVLSEACDDLKRQACVGVEVVSKIYRSLDLEDFPHATLLDSSWVVFRLVQMHLLFGLDYVRRYGFADLVEVPKRLEHDIHDVQYALFGTLCGALATRDKEVAQNFKLACPDGTLMV